MNLRTKNALRTWAAGIRDGACQPGVKATARSLCAAIDVLGVLESANSVDATEMTIAILVGRIIIEGVNGPQVN